MLLPATKKATGTHAYSLYPVAFSLSSKLTAIFFIFFYVRVTENRTPL